MNKKAKVIVKLCSISVALAAISVAVSGCGSAVGANGETGTESESSALSYNTSGQLMPFGGRYDTCLTTAGSSLTVKPCNAYLTQQSFFVDASGGTNPAGSVQIQNGGLCLDIPSTGKIGMDACNHGITQSWFVKGGQIVTAQSNGSANPICIDIFAANTSSNGSAVVDTTTCNGTNAQVFWTAGITIQLQSTLLSPSTIPNCLDLLGNNEKVGATIDDSVCNGTNAQWWILTENQQISLANSPSLCVGMDANPVNGLSQLEMQTCNSGTAAQKWYLFNQSGSGSSSGKATFVNSGAPGNECLDIKGDSNASPTTVDLFTCNGTTAQNWVPWLPGPVVQP